VAATIVRYGAMLFGTACAVQIYLAGLGHLRRQGAGQGRGPVLIRTAAGNILSGLALLLLIAVIVARPSRRVVITVIVLFVLTAGRGICRHGR